VCHEIGSPIFEPGRSGGEIRQGVVGNARGTPARERASFGNSARVSGLFEAELSEYVSGNLCGVSTGEASLRKVPRV
jgi:hypothetical protein